MWPRLRIDDVRAIVHYLGMMVLVIAGAMLVPLFVALLCREWDPALDLLVSFGVALTVGSSMRLVRPRKRGLTRNQALIVTGLAWIMAALVSSTPFVVGGYSTTWFDAIFDAASCYTNTGMTLMQDNAALPVSLGLWRHIMLVVGAQGIVLMALGLGTISRFSGAELLFEAEGHADRIIPRMAMTSRFIALFLCAFIALGTVVCTLICWGLCGLEPARAIYHGFCLAAGSVTTAGLSLMDIGLVYYHQPVLYVVIMVLMFMGTFSFAVYFRMVSKGARTFFQDIETRMILAWGLAVLVLLAVSFANDDFLGDIGTFLDKGIFTLVSSLTGSGFSTLSSSQLASVATPAVLFCFILGMSMGGATSSTAGGIKAIRMALVLKSIASEVRRVLLPTRARQVVRYNHLGSQVLTPDMSRSAMLVFLLFLLTYVVGGMIGVLYGYDPMAAMLESVSYTSNCGISSGITSADMPLGLKITYFVQMLAGRLEFVTLIAAFTSIAVSAARGVGDSPVGRAAVSAVPARLRRSWRGRKGTWGGRR